MIQINDVFGWHCVYLFYHESIVKVNLNNNYFGYRHTNFTPLNFDANSENPDRDAAQINSEFDNI